MKLIISLFALGLCSVALAIQASAGPYKLDVRTDPAVVPVGRAKILIKVTDSSGQPVSGATVKVLAQMPGMPMGERQETAIPGSDPGQYAAPAVFGMAGAYDASVEISGPKGTGKAVISLETGSSSDSAGRQIPFLGPVIALIVIALAAWLYVRLKRRGQRVGLGGFLTRQVLLSLLVLAAATVVSVWAVNKFRRPGSMTPMEAQGMEMSAPAPEGTLPVHLGTATSEDFSPTVNYSGQAVGFVEQDVVSRVTGTIVSMGVYVGDRVHKGQLLAQLDTSQLDPMVNEKAAGVTSAEEGASVSAMEYQQAVNMVAQARAESGMAKADVSEAQAMLDAARQGRTGAQSDVESALADVRAMQAEQQAAVADRTYQDQQLARMKTLFDRGAISKDEWQQTVAGAQKSSSMADKARENVVRAQAGVVSARAMLRKADAEISAARRKVEQAQSSLLAKQAAVQTAQSAADAARGKIGQSRADIAAAAAGLQGATTQRGYSRLTSQVEGVVTSRLISPGTVVNPGQVVMKVSQISPIRLQANVPESDLFKIHVGYPVRVNVTGSQVEVKAKVTSVSPAFDASSRTGVVEALLGNSDSSVLPGQYLSMTISLGQGAKATAIPTSAVQAEESDGAKKSYVWVASPAGNGEYTVSRKEITVGGSTALKTAVLGGITRGEKVVLSPPQGLEAGTRVTAPEPVVEVVSSAPQTIEINASGYNPPFVSIPANKAFQLIFVRTDEKACGNQIVFPELGIRKALPLNVKITVEIPPQPNGKELKFSCNMNMLNGKAIAK